MRRGAPARRGFGESPLRSVAALLLGRKALRSAVNGTEPRLPAPGVARSNRARHIYAGYFGPQLSRPETSENRLQPA